MLVARFTFELRTKYYRCNSLWRYFVAALALLGAKRIPGTHLVPATWYGVSRPYPRDCRAAVFFKIILPLAFIYTSI